MSSPPPVPANPASSTVAPLPQPLSPAKRALVAFLVLLGIALSVSKALLWSRGAWNAEVSGYAISAILIPLVISYLIAGRKKNRKPVLFGLIFAGIAFAFCLMELSSIRKDPNVEVADIIREVSGTKLSHGGGAFESRQDKLLREVMTELLDNAKAYREKAHDAQAELQPLYTAESFSSPEAMGRTRDSVQKITTLDHEFVLQLEQWPAHVREQTAESSLSDSEKQAFLKGFDESFSNSEIMALRSQEDQIESQWCKDTLALYDFARSHAVRIHVKNARILIDEDTVRTQFNDLLKQSRERHQKMVDTTVQLDKLQQASLQKFGLTKKDVGIVERNVPTPQVQSK